MGMKQSKDAVAPSSHSLTDIEGILVGHHTLRGRRTGCTVVTARFPMVAGVDVRGGAPGTRETDLLRPENTVPGIHAVFISGGSAFGLDVGGGVAGFLEEQGYGFRVGEVAVPVVCGAILFDLQHGDPKIRPDARAGYEAARKASGAPVPEGSVGAGAGCTVGKLFGPERAMKGGIGSWSWRRADGLAVGALVAVNCAGDVRDPDRGNIVAGARESDGGGFIDSMEQIRSGRRLDLRFGGNTVVGVVATNATLDKAACTVVARMAHDGLARCIYPAHTPLDGDTIFALATGRHATPCDAINVAIIGAMAADVVARAVVRGCR